MHSLAFKLVVLFLAGVCVQGLIEHRYGPRDTIVRQGETVTLYCAVNNQVDEHVFWYRIKSASGIGEVLSDDNHVSQGSRPSMGRYIIVGNHQDGEYHLRLTNAQHEDSGLYRCGFEDGEDSHSHEGANLSVMVPPTIGSPLCLLMTDNNVIGYNSQLSCLSSGGDPPAMVTWYRNGVQITTPTTHRNILNRVMLVEDVGATFSCDAESPAMDEMRSCSLVPLRQMPKVMISPRVGYASVGESMTFVCQKLNREPDDSYVWYINDDKILPGDTGEGHRFRLSGDKRSLTIGRVLSSDNNAEIVCKVDNGSAAIAATAAISVRGASQVYSTPPLERQATVILQQATDGRIPAANKDNSKTALIAISIIGGLAIAVLACVIYAYIQRKLRRKTQVAIPMTPRTMSQRSFRNFSFSFRLSTKSSRPKSRESSKSLNSSHEAANSSHEDYAALNMIGVRNVNYEDLKGAMIDKAHPTILPSTSQLRTSAPACSLPLPPISPSAPPLSHRLTSDTIKEFEDAESVDSYETIDEKILRPNRTEMQNRSDKKTSEYLEILP